MAFVVDYLNHLPPSWDVVARPCLFVTGQLYLLVRRRFRPRRRARLVGPPAPATRTTICGHPQKRPWSPRSNDSSANLGAHPRERPCFPHADPHAFLFIYPLWICQHAQNILGITLGPNFPVDHGVSLLRTARTVSYGAVSALFPLDPDGGDPRAKQMLYTLYQSFYVSDYATFSTIFVDHSRIVDDEDTEALITAEGVRQGGEQGGRPLRKMAEGALFKVGHVFRHRESEQAMLVTGQGESTKSRFASRFSLMLMLSPLSTEEPDKDGARYLAVRRMSSSPLSFRRLSPSRLAP
jgi:hypothetical protein